MRNHPPHVRDQIHRIKLLLDSLKFWRQFAMKRNQSRMEKNNKILNAFDIHLIINLWIRLFVWIFIEMLQMHQNQTNKVFKVVLTI